MGRPPSQKAPPAPAPLPSAVRADISWQTCFPSCGSWPALGSNPLLPFLSPHRSQVQTHPCPPPGARSARGYQWGREGAVGAPAGRSRIISLRSLWALVGTPRQGHTKVSKQVWGRGRAQPPPCVFLPVPWAGAAQGCVLRGTFLPFPTPSQTSAQGPHVALIVLATPGLRSVSHVVGAPWVQPSGWTERATAGTNQGSRARGG